MTFLKSLLATALVTVGMGGAIALPVRAHSNESHNSTSIQAEEGVKFEVIPVRGNIYVIAGTNGAGNIGVVTGEIGPILIDSQVPGVTNDLQTVILNAFNRRPGMLINTHWHFDHTGGNAVLGETGLTIVAHENARVRMAAGQVIESLNRTIPPAPEIALPAVTFTDSMTFHVNDEVIEAFHVRNAHTDGDIVIHFKNSDVIHMGDLVFNGLYPFIDVSSGGSINGMIAGVDQILEIASNDTKLIPGHGPLLTRAELVDYRTMLITVRDRMAAAIAKGKTLEQVLGMNINADYDETLGNVFLSPEQFATILYNDLSRDDLSRDDLPQ
ncbi:MAG: MBL fold metallo-hydrolase [Cyanobacteria bacterium P01_C01_bin.89]